MRDINLLRVASMIAPCIPGLLLARGPFAIFGSVVSVIINSLKSKFIRGPITHIGVKIFKFEPSFTNSDASTSIIRPIRFFGVKTSLLHVLPKIPLWHHFPSFSESVGGATLRCFFVCKTAATSAFAITQCRAINGFFCSAVTSAKPFSFSNIGKRDPSRKSLISNVIKCWHTPSLQQHKVAINA